MASYPRISTSRSYKGTRGADRKSDFHITVSSNKKPSSIYDAEALKEAMFLAADAVFNSPESLRRIVRFNIPHHDFDSKYIQDISTEIAPEIGTHPKGGRAHVHILLNIRHRSNLTILHSKRVIKEEILRTRILDPWGITNLYVNIKLIPNVEEATRVYLSKHQQYQGGISEEPATVEPLILVPINPDA